MSLQLLSSLDDIPAADWNAGLSAEQPFLSHAFLLALEASGSAAAATGWQAAHALWREADGRVRAVMPLYAKVHSQGEYVFDWGWADACQRAGIAYYPKGLSGVPFSPVVGPRIWGDDEAIGQLLQALEAEVEGLGWSGLHVNFTDPASSQVFAARQDQGWLARTGCQYHWFNRGYRDFQDFLDALSSRKRKQMRKERAQVEAQGLDFCWRAGRELSESEWDFVYRCYANTYWVRGRPPYLTRDCFSRLAEQLPEFLRIAWVTRQAQPVAMALYLQDGETLYGRYWGCLDAFRHLHFETCIYRGIEQAIAEGLQRFDAGAQGEHKLIRGFEPVLTHSWHLLLHPGLRAAVAGFLDQERQEVARYRQAALEALPYRQVD